MVLMAIKKIESKSGYYIGYLKLNRINIYAVIGKTMHETFNQLSEKINNMNELL